MLSPAVVRSLGTTGRSPLLARLLADAKLQDTYQLATVQSALQQAFDILRSTGNRDDYVYRSAVTQKLFVARHSFRTATPLFEARTGSSRADVVILNGTSTAYEIKSERDSMARIHNQLLDYRQVWATVNVVTSPSRVNEVLKLVPSDVGVIALTRRFTLHVEKEAIASPERTSPLLTLDALRNDEAHEILARIGIEKPSLPNTLIRSYLRSEFSRLDPATAHNHAVEVLKRSRSFQGSEFSVRRLPLFLRAASMSQRFSDHSYARLQTALATPLPQALTWS
jgi:hypothetical protein